MNFKRLVSSYMSLKTAGHPQLPSTLPPELNTETVDEAWVIEALSIVKKTFKLKAPIKAYGPVAVMYAFYSLGIYGVFGFSIGLKKELKVEFIAPSSTQLRLNLLNMSKVVSGPKEAWDFVRDVFGYVGPYTKGLELHKTLQTHIGLSFDYYSVYRPYLKVKFSNETEGVFISLNIDEAGNYSDLVLDWKNDPEQKFDSLEDLLDAIPTEYDDPMLLFKDKKFIKKLNVDISKTFEHTPLKFGSSHSYLYFFSKNKETHLKGEISVQKDGWSGYIERSISPYSVKRAMSTLTEKGYKVVHVQHLGALRVSLTNEAPEYTDVLEMFKDVAKA